MQRDGGRCPVTAVAFAGSRLLAALGTHLEVYDWERATLLTTIAIFDGQSIHGILVHDGSSVTVLLWGGTLVAALHARDISDIDHAARLKWLIRPRPVLDWMLAGYLDTLHDHDNGERCVRTALVTAHNVLVLVDLDSSVEDIIIPFGEAQSKSILFCATIHSAQPNHYLVAAGTCFGDILVWSADQQGSSWTTRLRVVLTGHEGSAFGLAFSGMFSDASSLNPSLLASCGDDRTVRIWDLGREVDVHNTRTQDAENNTQEHVMTGYQIESSAPRTLLAQSMGHQSRIWKIAVLPAAQDAPMYHMMTFGEDATCQYWSYHRSSKEDADGKGRLLRLGRFDCHAGKHIWSFAVAKFGSRMVVATGGADGGITIHDVPDEWSDCSRAVTLAVPTKTRSFANHSDGTMLLCSNEGRIFRARPSEPSCHGASQYPDLIGFSMMASAPDLDAVFLAGRTGSLYQSCSGMDLVKVTEGVGKATGIFTCRSSSSNATVQQNTAFCMLCPHQTLTALLVEVDSQCRLLRRWSVQVPQDEQVTSIGHLRGDASGSRLLVAGLRSGTLAVYRLSDDECVGEAAVVQCGMLEKVHEDAITDIRIFIQEHTGLILLTSRDGSYSVHEINDQAENPVSVKVHHLPVPAMTAAHRILHSTQTDELAIAGFDRQTFVVWSVTSEQEILSIPYHGSGGSWTFQPSADFLGGTLAWTQSSQVQVQHARRNDTVVRINSGGHGREIRAIAVSSGHTSSVGRIIATGAEDTDIKLSVLDRTPSGHPQLRCLRTLRRHNTGVQGLEWSEDGRYLVSSGGCEELFIWRVRNVPLLGIGVVCESTCPFLSEEPDLRILSIEVGLREEAREGTDVTAGLTIASARSDSSIHIYHYGTREGIPNWTCAWKGSYLTCCLTNMLSVNATQGKRPSYLITGTDGHAAIMFSAHRSGYDGMKWLSRSKLHQNAVHAARLIPWTEDTQLLFTGGDDNALSISIIRHQQQDAGVLSFSTLTIPRAHAAAVTAVEVLSVDRHRCMVELLTAGLDQRVKTWHVEVDVREAGCDGLLVRRMGDRYTSIADIADVGSWVDDRSKLVMLVGVGWEVWRI